MRHALLFFAAGMLIAADGPKQDKEKIAKEVQGTWEGVTAEQVGKKGKLGAAWEVKEEKIIETNAKGTGEWKYRVDPAKTPKEIDLTPNVGPAAGKTLKGIYKIEKDTLTICYVGGKVEDPEKKERPTEFDTKKRDDVVILTFQRKAP